MKKGYFLFFIIGTVLLFFVTTNVNSLQTFMTSKELEPKKVGNVKEIPKKNDLIGKYIVKNDKNSYLVLNEDGTYNLNLNVCESYLLLSGKYELLDSKLKIYNDYELLYEDLNGNTELSFMIINQNTIKSLESLVCTEQETLFEK